MRIGILCSYEDGLIGGQTSKTLELIKGAEKKYGKISVVNQKKTRGNYISFFFQLFDLFLKSDHIMVILASPGYLKILPIIIALNSIFHKHLYEIVIGGIRHQYIAQKRIRIHWEKQIDKIYVESNSMVNEYLKMNIKQVEYLPNFKDFTPISVEEMRGIFEKTNELRLCTFSRVDSQKGIDIAIKAVRRIKELYPQKKIMLDIFGPLDQKYKNDFELLMLEQPDGIEYKGCIYGEKIIDTLKEYSCLLCPTRWETEGFPGAFIDAMAAGLPVITTDRENFRDIVNNGINGYLIEENNTEKYSRIIMEFVDNTEKLWSLKKNALEEAEKYQAENVLKKIWSQMEAEK